LPLDCASALGGALARRIGPLLGVSKHARRNISRAFPELSETEIARVVAGMWDNLGRVAAEYPHLAKIRVFDPGGRVKTRGFEHVDRAVAAGRQMSSSPGMEIPFRLPVVIVGIIEESITRSPPNPITRHSGSTAAHGSSARPIRQVPHG
jgi:hypothetical protein